MKVPVARSNTRLRFIFGLKVKSKLSRVLLGSRNAACFRRRSSNRSVRRLSSSVTRQAMRSMGAMVSACAWRSGFPAPRPCRRAGAVVTNVQAQWGSCFVLLGLVFDEVAVQGELADERIDLP